VPSAREKEVANDDQMKELKESNKNKNKMSDDEYKRLKNAIEKSAYRGTAAFILHKIADLSQVEGYCYAGHKKLARNCGISKTTLIRYLKPLEVDGVLRIQHRVGDDEQNYYRINIDVLGIIVNPTKPIREARWKKCQQSNQLTVQQMATQLVAASVLPFFGGIQVVPTGTRMETSEKQRDRYNPCSDRYNPCSATNLAGARMETSSGIQVVPTGTRMETSSGTRMETQTDLNKGSKKNNINERVINNISKSENQNQPQQQPQTQKRDVTENPNPYPEGSVEFLMLNALTVKRPTAFTENLNPFTFSDMPPAAPEAAGGAEGDPCISMNPEIVGSQIDELLAEYCYR
jgi:hypothetical protein